MRLSLILITLLAVFPLWTTPASAQGDYSTTNKKAISDFNDAFRYFRMREYENAEVYLQSAIKRDPQFLEALILMAEIGSAERDWEQSITWFNKALAVNAANYPQMFIELAKAEMRLLRYGDAVKTMERFQQQTEVPRKFVEEGKQVMANAKFGEVAVANPVPFDPVNMGPNVNSEYPEYFPGITTDGNTLLYTRQLPEPRSPVQFNEDFYMASRQDDVWAPARNIGRPINSLFNEGAPTLAADGQRIIFTACAIQGRYGRDRKGYGSCDLFTSVRIGDKWSIPKNLGPKVNSPHWETQPSFSADGKTLYFVRGIKSKATGNKAQDIYVTTLDDLGNWTPAQRLSKTVNTPGREESVCIHPDGKTLYFSSDGHPGMGGTDIYVTRKGEDGEWSTPVNLGYPINTGSDENSLLVSPDGTIGYFASDREGGQGDLDLYYFPLPENARAQKVTFMKGKVFNKETRDPLRAKFELIDLETGEVVIQSFSNKGNGQFLVSLPEDRDYALNANLEGFAPYSENFSFSSGGNTSGIGLVKNVPMVPLKEGETFTLKNIFFETAKFNLKSQSQIELDRLVRIMQSQPTLKLEVGGHTDNAGSAASNQTLSENRAKAVRDYMVEKGVTADRLTAKGYGQTQPKESNDTEAGRAANRRTEFTVLAK